MARRVTDDNKSEVNWLTRCNKANCKQTEQNRRKQAQLKGIAMKAQLDADTRALPPYRDTAGYMLQWVSCSLAAGLYIAVLLDISLGVSRYGAQPVQRNTIWDERPLEHLH